MKIEVTKKGFTLSSFIFSAIFHLLTLLVIILFSLKNHEDIIRKKEEVITRISEEKEVTEITKTINENSVYKEALKNEMLSEIESVIPPVLDEENASNLREEINISLEEYFNNEEVPITSERIDEIRESMYSLVAENTEQMLVSLLVSQLKAYISNEAVPMLKMEIEENFNRENSRIKKEFEYSIEKNWGTPSTKTADRTIDNLKTYSEKALNEYLNGDFANKATDEVLSVFNKEIASLNIETNKLGTLIKKEIRTLFLISMSNNSPDSSLLYDETKIAYGNVSSEDFEEAKKSLKKAKEEFSLLKEKQQKINSLSEQKKISSQIEDAYKLIEKASVSILKVNRGEEALKIKDMSQRKTALSRSKHTEKEFEKDNKTGAEKSVKQTTLALNVVSKALEKIDESLLKNNTSASEFRDGFGSVEKDNSLNEEEAEFLAKELKQPVENISIMSVREVLSQYKAEGILFSKDNSKIENLLALSENLAKLKGQKSPSRIPSVIPYINNTTTGIIRNYSAKIILFNREAYEEFIKDMESRVNPTIGKENIVKIVPTVAKEKATFPSQKYYINDEQKRVLAEEEIEQKSLLDKKRSIPNNPYNSSSYSAINYITNEVVIDGNVGEWINQTKPLKMKYFAQNPEKVDTGVEVYMGYSSEGIYFAYSLTDSQISIPKSRTPHSGDVMEFWIDMSFTRNKIMRENEFAHQFVFCPFGMESEEGIKPYSFAEMGRGFRDMKMYNAYIDKSSRIYTKGKKTREGYTVEAFLPKNRLSKPILLPGMTIIANISVNSVASSMQWSASKSTGTWDKPDTWGDIKLLGTDASLSFLGKDYKEIDYTYQGAILIMRIIDKDMNIRYNDKDRIFATLSVKSVSGELSVILEENENNSGIFYASVNLNPFFSEASKSAIGVREGDILTLKYSDVCALFGEENIMRTKSIAVAHSLYSVVSGK